MSSKRKEGKSKTEIAKELRKARAASKQLKKSVKEKYKSLRESSKHYLRKYNSESASPVEVTHTQLRERKEFSGHFNKIYSIDTSPHGELISGGIDENVIVWDIASGIKVDMIVGKVRQVTAVCFSPDGTGIAFGGMTNECCIYSRSDMTKEQHTLSSHDGYITKCEYIDDGTLATASGDGTIKLWDVITGRELASYKGHGKHVTTMDVNKELGVILSASYDGVVKIWDPREEIDEKKDAAADEDDAADESGRSRTGTIIGHTGEVSAVRWFPANNAFATGGDDGYVRLWDLRTRRHLNEYELPDGRPRTERGRSPSQVHAIEFLQSGCGMYVGYDVGARMVGFDTVTCDVIQEIPHEFDVHDLKVDSEGFAMLSACWDYNVRLFA